MSGIDYISEKDGTNMPKVLQGEEIYLWQEGVTLIEKRGEFRTGVLLLTTYNLFWYSSTNPTQVALKIPLFYIGEMRTSGGWFTNEKLSISLVNRDMQPPYAQKLYHDILKQPVPPLPSYPEKIKLEFTAKGRDKFQAKLKEALAAKHWEHIGTSKEEIKFISKGFRGVAGIKESIQIQTKQMANVISSSFADLDSLRDSAKKLVWF
eukprot:TRINITY_DN120608_c0_g1_i1.p1 TRINITY_DN120608_c0_g1~~TRINITY_DN120608_c0_g1_i1.p1  ORF type:complete len:231 (-),score=29.76 TRINITY_DN120608_c0_g1_i1:1457-2077(-)